MSDLIRGKVARVLNSREVALNVGKEDGVDRGMQFDVLDPKLDEIKDPDSGDVIGVLNRPKVRVQVSIVGDRFSVARTFRAKRVNIGGSGTFATYPDIFEPPNWVLRSETLQTSERTWEDLSPAESYVKIGDPAVEVPHGMRSKADEEPFPPSRDADNALVRK